MFSCETITSISFRTSPSLHKGPCPLGSHSQFLSPQTTNLLSVSLHPPNGILQYVIFSIWRLSTSMFLRFIHVVHVLVVYSFLLSFPFTWIYYIFIHSPVDEHLDCFQFGAITNAATNICIQALYTHIFSFISVDTYK